MFGMGMGGSPIGMGPMVQFDVRSNGNQLVGIVQYPNGQQEGFNVVQNNGQHYIQIGNQYIPLANNGSTYLLNVNNQWVGAAEFFTTLMQNNIQQQQNNPMNAAITQGSMFQQPSNIGAPVMAPGTGNADRSRWGNSVYAQASDKIKEERQASPLSQAGAFVTKQSQPEVKAVQVGKMEGVSEMQSITLLGTTFNLNGTVRMDGVKTALRTLTTVKDEKSEQDVLMPTLLYMECLDEMFTNARISLVKGRGDGQKIYRVFGMVLHPVIAEVKDGKKYVERLKSALTMAEMAKELSSIGESLSRFGDDKDVIGSIEMVASLDQMLTDVVNSFLQHNMGLAAVRISSFAEDVCGLSAYLTSTFGEEYGSALNKLEDSLLDTWKNLVGEAVKHIEDSYEFDEGVSVVLFPSSVSVTSINLTSKELGFVVKPGMIQIDRSVAPVVYKLSESLNGHKRLLGATMGDYLMTSDNVKFRIYSNALKDNEYSICKL